MAYGATTPKLEAINQMLSTIGQARVATLQTSGEAYDAQKILEEVDKAVQSEGWHFNRLYNEKLYKGTGTLAIDAIATNVNVTTQKPHYLIKGEKITVGIITDVTVSSVTTADTFVADQTVTGTDIIYANRVVTPTTALLVDLNIYDYNNADPIVRGKFIYDKSGGTYEFNDDLTAVVVYQVPFEQSESGEPALPEYARRFITMRAARVFAQRHVGDPQLLQFCIQEERDAYTQFLQAEADNSDISIFDSALPYYTVARNSSSNIAPISSLYRVKPV